MHYKKLVLGNSIFLFFRNGRDKKIEVVRSEWTERCMLRSSPEYQESKIFDSEEHAEQCFKNLFHVEVTQ